MKQLLLILAVVALLGCGGKNQSEIVEEAIRMSIKKPENDLNKTDFENVTWLYLGHTQFTDAGFAELTKLEKLSAIYLDSTEITDKGLMVLANLNQLKKIVGLKFDRVLFDNMSTKNIVKGIKISNKLYETEASGGITLKNVKKIASTGVKRLSVGQITHSAPSVNFKLEV